MTVRVMAVALHHPWLRDTPTPMKAVVPSHPCDHDTPTSLSASFPNRLGDIGNPVFYTVVELVPRCLGDDGLVHIDIHWRLLLAILVAWLLLDFRYRWGDSEMTVRVMAATLSHPCDRDTPSSMKASFPNRLSDIGNPVFYTVVELVPRCLGDDGLVHTDIHVAVTLSHPCGVVVTGFQISLGRF